MIITFIKNYYKKIIIAIIFVVVIVCGYYFIPGKMVISVNVQNAEITLDHQKIDQKIKYLFRGEHLIQADFDDYQSNYQEFKIRSFQIKHINIELLKITELSADSNKDDLVDIKIESSMQNGYVYLDETLKSIKIFQDNSSLTILNLDFLNREKILKFKWSNDRSFLFIKTVKEKDFISSYLINTKEKSINKLNYKIKDIAFYNNEYYLLKADGVKSIVLKDNQQVLKIDKDLNNIEYNGKEFALFDTLLDKNSNIVYFCNKDSKCRNVSLDGDIYQISIDNSHVVAITLKQQYLLYDITNGVKLIDSNVTPLVSWDKLLYYQKADQNCAIKMYDFNKTNIYYENSLVCDIGEFSINNNIIYVLQGINPYKLEK